MKLLAKIFTLVTVFVSFLVTIDFIETKQLENLIFAEKERIIEVFPTLKARSEIEYLVREPLLRFISENNSITSENLKDIENNIVSEFPDAKWFLTDGNSKPLSHRGIPQPTLASISTLIQARIENESTALPSKYDRRGIEKQVFSPIDIGSFENRAFIGESNFLNEWGYITMGVFADKTIPATDFQQKLNFYKLFKEKLKKTTELSWEELHNRAKTCKTTKCHGGFFIFVPKESIRNPQWFYKAISRPPPGCPFQFWGGKIEDIAYMDSIPTKLKENILNSILSDTQTVIVSDGWIAGAVKTGDKFQAVQIIFSKPKLPIKFSKHGGFQALCGTVLLVMILGIFLDDRKNYNWKMPLLQKFLAISIFVGLFPMLGVIWISSFNQIAQVELARRLAYKTMEDKLKHVEHQVGNIKGEIVTEIKELLFQKFNWAQFLPSDEQLLQILLPLFRMELSSFFCRHRELGRLYLHQIFANYGYATIVRGEIKDFSFPFQQVLAFSLKILENALGFHEAKDSKFSSKDLTIGLIYESINSAPKTRQKIFNFLVNYDQLQLLQIFRREAIWVYLHIMKDKNAEPTAIFFLAFNRPKVERAFAYQIVSQNTSFKKQLPTFAMMDTNFSSNPTVYPEPCVFEPAIQQILFLVAREGGFQKATIKIANKRALVLAMKLKDFDYAAMVIEPDPADEITTQNLTSTAKVGGVLYLILVLIIISIWFHKFYIDPINQIQHGVNEITAGNYEKRLSIITKDEMGQFAESFNRMAAGLKEKEFMSRFLSDLAMEAVKKSGKPPATKLEATVLFSDIRDFTTISENLSPEIIVEMLNNHLTRMEEVIELHGGTIDKFIGDAIMAVFFPLHGRESPVERAIKAGLAMIQKTNEENIERNAQGLFPIHIGVGIATGEVLMGVLGKSSGRQDFTVTGKTVNLAAKMEKRTKEASISFVVVCEKTKLAAEEKWQFIELPNSANYPKAFEVLLS